MNSGDGGEGGNFSNDQGKSSKINKLILILIIVILFVAILGILFYFLTRGQKDEIAKQEATAQAQNELQVPTLNQPFIAKDENFEQNPFFSDQLDFTINLNDGRRFLKCKITLGLTSETALEFLSSRLPVVKDIIITTTQLMTATDFRSGTGVDQYKRNLIVKINSAVFTQEFKEELEDPNPVKKVLLEEFILQ